MHPRKPVTQQNRLSKADLAIMQDIRKIFFDAMMNHHRISLAEGTLLKNLHKEFLDLLDVRLRKYVNYYYLTFNLNKVNGLFREMNIEEINAKDIILVNAISLEEYSLLWHTWYTYIDNQHQGFKISLKIGEALKEIINKFDKEIGISVRLYREHATVLMISLPLFSALLEKYKLMHEQLEYSENIIDDLHPLVFEEMLRQYFQEMEQFDQLDITNNDSVIKTSQPEQPDQTSLQTSFNFYQPSPLKEDYHDEVHLSKKIKKS